MARITVDAIMCVVQALCCSHENKANQEAQGQNCTLTLHRIGGIQEELRKMLDDFEQQAAEEGVI